MNTARPQRPRSPRGEGESLRGDILAAADELITEAGSGSDLSLRAIARRTGVSPMTLYRHFDTLDAIVDEVQRQHYVELVEVLRDRVGKGPDGLSAFARAFVEYGLSNPGRFRLMFAMPLNPERVVPDDKQILGTPALELLVGTMRAHLAKHRLERDPWRSAITFWATLHGIVHLRLSVGMRGDYPWPPIETQIADALAPFSPPPTHARSTE